MSSGSTLKVTITLGATTPSSRPDNRFHLEAIAADKFKSTFLCSARHPGLDRGIIRHEILVSHSTVMSFVRMKQFVVLIGLLNLFGLTLFACSYADGSLFPTRYDYVKETEAIILAQPVAKVGGVVDFTILEVLKGDFSDRTFQGFEINTSCIALSFSLEVKGPPVSAQRKAKPKYLIFLRRFEDGWKISYSASEAMNEIIVDVDSSPFLKSIRHLVRTSSKNNYEAEKIELTRLKQMAQSRRNPKDYPIELARFVDEHLEAATPTKSYADLRKLYARSSGEKARDALWAMAHGKHPEAAQFFDTMLGLPIPANYLGPISKYVELTKNESMVAKLGKNTQGWRRGSAGR